MEGINLTPELLEKAMASKEPKELIELCKEEGVEITEELAEKIFAKLNENSPEELSNVKGSGCFQTKCPKCGSTNVSKSAVPISPTDCTLYCHCNHCGCGWVIG